MINRGGQFDAALVRGLPQPCFGGVLVSPRLGWLSFPDEYALLSSSELKRGREPLLHSHIISKRPSSDFCGKPDWKTCSISWKGQRKRGRHCPDSVGHGILDSKSSARCWESNGKQRRVFSGLGCQDFPAKMPRHVRPVSSHHGPCVLHTIHV